MRYLFGALLFTTALFAAESRFSEAEAKFNREYDAAKAVFDRAVKVARDKLVVAYNEEMKRLTVKGDLDGAVALRDKIKSFDVKIEIGQFILGNWFYTSKNGWKTILTFNEDNTFTARDGSSKTGNHWEFSDVLSLIWNNGDKRILKWNSDKMIFSNDDGYHLQK